MSLRPRSELHLRLGARRCEAEVWHAGFARRPALRLACQAGEPGVGDDLLGTVLARLEAERVKLPRRASLVVDDDSLYHALLPADAAWGSGEAHARRYFEGALDAAELLVAVALAPCGRRWLAVALERAWVAAVEARLAQHGVKLGGVSAAVFEDLDTLGRSLPPEGWVALVREAGLVLLRREAGAWTDLRWERCDGLVADAVARPLDARARRDAAAAVLLVAEHPRQAESLAALAAQRGWTLAALARGAVA